MRTNLYYGEIVVKIAEQFFNNPQYNIQKTKALIEKESDDLETIWTLIAEAGRVFDSLEDVIGDLNIDWLKAIDYYAIYLQEHLSNGKIPSRSDMASMAICGIENAK